MSKLKSIRTTLLAATIVAAATGTQAQSLVGASLTGTAGSQLAITGFAPDGCVITTPTQGAITNATLTPGGSSAQVTILQLVDPNTAVPQAASVDMRFPVICNTAHTLTISTAQGGLVLQGGAAPGPGLRNRLDYQVSAIWDGQQVTGGSTAPVQIVSPNAATGQLDVNIAIPAGGLPLVAGTYSDSLIVNLIPAS